MTGKGENRMRQDIQSQKEEMMRLEIESASHNEQFARVVVAAFLTRLDPTVEEMEDVKTAVSEAVTNSIIHGYEGGPGKILLTARVKGKEFCVSVKDEGIGIPDIVRAMEPLYTSKPGAERSGMGFSFMEAFMDEVKVTSAVGKGTTVTMKKTIGIGNRL